MGKRRRKWYESDEWEARQRKKLSKKVGEKKKKGRKPTKTPVNPRMQLQITPKPPPPDRSWMDEAILLGNTEEYVEEVRRKKENPFPPFPDDDFGIPAPPP